MENIDEITKPEVEDAIARAVKHQGLIVRQIKYIKMDRRELLPECSILPINQTGTVPRE